MTKKIGDAVIPTKSDKRCWDNLIYPNIVGIAAKPHIFTDNGTYDFCTDNGEPQFFTITAHPHICTDNGVSEFCTDNGAPQLRKNNSTPTFRL